MNTCVIATFVMPDITKLAEERSKTTDESFMSWHDALSKGMKLAEDAMIDPDAFLMLTRNCSHSTQFLSIIEALNAHSKENPYGGNAFNLLDCFVEKSSYALKDWLEGLEYFCDWLRQNAHQAGLITMLNYISGCINNGSNTSTRDFNLRDLVEKVLRTYGFQD